MPRIRTLKPDFWSDKRMVKLSPYARLFYMGMWNFALCDNGHLPDDAEELKLKILPVDPVDPDELLDELVNMDRVRRCTTADGGTYLWARKLSHHQKVDGRWQPRCPYCKEQTTPNPADSARITPKREASQPTTENHAETRAGSGEPHRDSPEPAGAQPDSTKNTQERKGREGSSGTGSTVANGRNAYAREAARPPVDDPPNNDPPGPIEHALGYLRSLLPDGRLQPKVQADLARYVADAFAVGTPPETIHEALRVWSSRQGAGRCGPGVLPSIIQDLSGGPAEPDRKASTDLAVTNVVRFPGRKHLKDINERSAYDSRPDEWLARARAAEAREGP